MKTLMLLVSISVALIMAACSSEEHNITSPVSSELDKSTGEVQIFPYKLYQPFPELKSALVSWQNEKEGITVVVSDRSVTIANRYLLFAVLDYVNDKGAAMAFLGDSRTGKYYLRGFTAEKIKAISIFSYDISISTGERILPYPQSQLFNYIGVKGWADGGSYVKVSAYPFTSNTKQVFAELIASEENQLVFLGKPQSENFDFPKSRKLNLKDIKLFALQQ